MRRFRFPSPEENRIEVLETENAELLLKSAINETKIDILENENASILLKLAELEVGKDV